MDMDTRSVESFFTTQSAWSTVPSEGVVASSDRNHSHQLLDLDALQVALTELDHSPQKDKSWISRQLNRRLPSRGSARSSTDSVQLLADQQEIERTVRVNSRKNYQHIVTNRNIDYVNESIAPKVVNISIHVEGEDNNGDLKNITDKESLNNNVSTLERKRRDSGKCSYENLTRKFSNFSESSFQSFHSRKSSLQERSFKPQTNNSPAQYSHLKRRSISSVGGSSPLLGNTASEAEQSYWKIKDEIAKLANRRRSSGSISASCVSSEDFTSLDPRPLRKESLLDTSAIKESEENRSSSEADVVISDRESIASSGTVNRRTVIRISEKSKSAASLISESSASLLSRDQDSRRSLRSDNNCRIIPIELDPDFEGGINVSIVNQQEPERRDSTSRMYVRQSDSENRPSRASAFNVRRTIEKRQIQQERRERKALRDQIREQLRSLSESRSRKDSTSSHTTNYSQSSIRSKSLSSLDQDLDDYRCESPLTKVQSSPTLEKEKEDVRSYLFETNLTSPQSSQAMSPTSRDSIYSVTKEAYPIIDKGVPQEDKNTTPKDPTNKWSWEALKAAKEKTEEKKRRVSKSYDSVQDSKETSRRSSFQSSVPSLVSPRLPWQDIKLRSTPQRAKLIAQEREDQPTPQRAKLIAEEREEQPAPQKAKSISQEKKEPIYSEIPIGAFKPENKFIHNITVEREEDTNFRPTPPPRRNRLTRSTGQLKLESEDKPTWVRLAKERRSLRSSRQVDQLSDRASTASKEPEWVAQARKKLENLNVCLTSTTDYNSVCSQLTESSAWSRGGLDALDEIKEETKRIGEELAEEANARVDADLGIKKDTSKMLEYKIDRSREPSAERLKVSFEVSNVEKSESEVHQTSRKSQKDEVRFGDLKHDWGGVQNKSAALSSGKQKEMRFGEVHVKETSTNDSQDKPREMKFGEYQRSKASPPRSASNSANNSPTGSNAKLPVMHFGDTPLNLFPSTASTRIIPVQSSSKFESIAGPDPMGMTAEQLNQNVEEYDFPIPTGKEDTTEFLKMLEEDLKKVELVPEFVCNHDSNPKPKSILKRRSVENVLHELKKEEKSEWLQKVDHRKSASFDWDTVGKGVAVSLENSHTRKLNHGGEQHFNNREKHTKYNTSATNGNFFNVKLRHVSTNKHDTPNTNEQHSYHTDHSVFRRPNGIYSDTDRHSGDFSSVDLVNNKLNLSERRVSTGGSSHGSSSASSQESLIDSSNSHESIVKDQVRSETHTENQEERGRQIQNQSNDRFKPRSRSSSTLPSSLKVCGDSQGMQDFIKRANDPLAPSWVSCRNGRGLTHTEYREDNNDAEIQEGFYEDDEVHKCINECNLLTSSVTVATENTNDLDQSTNTMTEITTTNNIISSSNNYITKCLENELTQDNSINIVDNQETSNESIKQTYITTCILTPGQPNTLSTDNKPATSSSSTRKFEAPTETSQNQNGINELQSKDSEFDKPHQEDVNSSQPSGKVFTFTFNSDYKTVSNKSLRDLPEDNKSKNILVNNEDTKIQEGQKRLTIVTNPNDVVKSDSTYSSTIANGSVKENMRNKSPVRLENMRNKSPVRLENMRSKSPVRLENMRNESTVRLENMRNKSIVRHENNEHKDMISTNQSAPEIPPRNHRIPVLSPKLINRTVPEVSTKSVLVTSHSDNHSMSSSKINKTEEPPQNHRIPLLSPKLINKTVPEVSTKSPLVTNNSHNHSLSNSRINKTEEKSNNKINNDIQQVTIEIVDEEIKKRNLKKKEQESRNNSLIEWEAIQRQKIEEEEKNRINKHLSMKPVSTKIKELVFNVFSKEKKTDINGTVDGKEDIVFRKVSTDNISDSKPSKIVETIHPLKSAYIVNKMMSPLKSQSSHREGTYNRSSRKSSSTDTSLDKSSRSVSDDRKTDSRNIKSDSYNRKEDILSTKSSHKNRKNSQKESKLINKHSRSSFDSENSSLSHKSNNTSSPDRRHKAFNSLILDDNEKAFNTNETQRSSFRDVKRRLNFENCDNTPKKENKDDILMDERCPKEDLNSKNKLKEFTISNEEYSSNQHSNIKDPKVRQEWLNKMLSTLDSNNKSQKTVDITGDSHKLNDDIKDMKCFNKKSQIMSRESNDKDEISQPNSQSLENRKNIVNKITSESLVKDPVLSDLKTNMNSSSKNYTNQVKEDPILDTVTQSKSSEEKANSISFSAETASSPKQFLTKNSSRISHTTELGTSLSSKLQTPLSSLSSTSSPSTSLLNLSSPSVTKKASSYSSLRSSLPDVSESTSRPSKRGPVSLFSIIGETSSRSSSQASTPLTSPRATPERIIKKDPIDPSTLDIIPESKFKSSLDKNIEKENIAPIANGHEESSSSEDENQDISNFDNIPRYSFRLRNGYKDNSKVNKEENNESSDMLQKKAITSVEYGDRDKPNQLINSWKPSSYKPFNFGKPSLTLKAMTSDVDTERVSTSKIKNKNISTEELQPQISLSQKIEKPIIENHQLETLQNKEEISHDKKGPFLSRFANHRSSLRGRVPNPANKGSKDLTLPNKLDLKNDAKESFASRFSTERSSLRKDHLNESTKQTDKSPINENALSDQINSTFSRFSSDGSSLNEKKENVNLDDAEEHLIKRLGIIEHRKNSFATRFNSERLSLRGKKTSEDNSLSKDVSLSKTNYTIEEGRGSFASRFNEERDSQRLQERTGRLSPDHVPQPVSLSSILLKDVDPKDSNQKDSSGCQFKPRLSFSDELKNMSEKYSSTLERQNSCESLLSDDSLEVGSKESSPERELHVSIEDNVEETIVEPERKLSDAPSLLPKSSNTPKNKGRNVVRRNSSLKRHRSNQPANSSTPVKKERKSSEESNAGDVKSECIMQDQSGRWVKTKTTVRRSRLNSGGSDKSSRSITRTNSGRGKEKTFKKDASKALEAWAANTDIQGKIMKKEGQRFSHETTEETSGGQVITKSVGRRMIRRGSRRMSGGGEMLTETKETSTTGNPSDISDPLSLVPVTGSADPNVSRKMKTATDGEHYMTQSVSNRDGREIFSTEGVNNKTTTSEEVIGGDEFEAKRHVTGKTGHRVVVEQMNDKLGRPSTTVKKITTTSKVTVTKAKRKAAIEV